MKNLFLILVGATLLVACKPQNVEPVKPVKPDNPTSQRLATPANLKWEGSFAKWDKVPNAASYVVTLYENGTKKNNYTTNDTDYEFESLVVIGDKYKFSVQAESKDPNYTQSEVAMSEEMTAAKPTPPTAILSVVWNEDYSITFTTDQPAKGAKYDFIIFRASDNEGIVSGPANHLNSVAYTGNSATISKERIKGAVSSITENGNYYVTVRIYDSNPEISNKSTNRAITVQCLSIPTNLRWEGKVAKWDTVPNATSYFLWLYEDDSQKKVDITSTTRYDFGSSMTVGKKYKFNVQAQDGSYNYSNSEVAIGPEMTR